MAQLLEAGNSPGQRLLVWVNPNHQTVYPLARPTPSRLQRVAVLSMD
jgi:hypothetical protein